VDVGHGVVVRVQPFRIGLIAGRGGGEASGVMSSAGGEAYFEGAASETEECRGL
jgi:hypothetical protein